MPHHPGGPLIHVHAGRDCTHLFDSYHPLYVQGMLAKYRIGALQHAAASQAAGEGADGGGRGAVGEEPGPAARYEDDLADGGFYRVLKQRVESMLREQKLDPRSSVEFQAKARSITFLYTKPHSLFPLRRCGTFEHDCCFFFAFLPSGKMPGAWQWRSQEQTVKTHQAVLICAALVGLFYGALFARGLSFGLRLALAAAFGFFKVTARCFLVKAARRPLFLLSPLMDSFCASLQSLLPSSPLPPLSL